MKRAFADTSYFIADIAPNDIAHGRAEGLAAQSLRLVTTSLGHGGIGGLSIHTA
jgi:hypothetical protein